MSRDWRPRSSAARRARRPPARPPTKRAGAGLPRSSDSRAPDAWRRAPSRSAPAKCSGSRDSSAPGAASCCMPSSAPIASARGEVRLQGRRVRRSPRAAVSAGIALVPEDRQRQALVPEFPLSQNLTLAHLGQIRALGALHARAAPRRRPPRRPSSASVSGLAVSATPVTELSGGNAQKVSIARWLCGPTQPSPPR